MSNQGFHPKSKVSADFHFPKHRTREVGGGEFKYCHRRFSITDFWRVDHENPGGEQQPNKTKKDGVDLLSTGRGKKGREATTIKAVNETNKSREPKVVPRKTILTLHCRPLVAYPVDWPALLTIT